MQVSPNIRLREQIGVGTPENLTTVLCKITSVDGTIASCTDQLGKFRQVSTTRMFGKGVGPPQTGETWAITSMFGFWVFAFQINPTYLDLITQDELNTILLGYVTNTSLTTTLSNYVLTGDSRLSDARTPTGTAGGVLSGTYPNPTIPTPSVTLIGSAGAPAFQNSWQNEAGFNSLGYYKDAIGHVHLTGRAQQASLTTLTNSVIFTLPAGFCPSGPILFSIAAGNGNLAAQVRIDGTGAVTEFETGTTTGGALWVNLDGVTFLATQ